MHLLLCPQLSLPLVLSTWTTVFTETADPSVKDVQAAHEHSISNHFLLSHATLHSFPLPPSKPSGALAWFSGVLFKIPQDPNVIMHPEHGPLLIPAIGHFGGWEREPYV